MIKIYKRDVTIYNEGGITIQSKILNILHQDIAL